MSGSSLLPRIGMGLDVHRFAEGRRLVLGGVTIPYPLGLAGHSDGDALCHATIDALLGAAARGDIGQWFPPGDPRFADADSLELLRQVAAALRAEGWRVVNVDTTVVCQQPRLAGYVEAMRHRLAEALGIPVGDVGLKATTTDGLGALGRGEGIGAQAVALLIRTDER